MTSSKGIGVTSERSFISSSQYLLGSTSECMDMICPSLIKVGPRSSMISLSFFGVTPRVMLCFRSTAVFSLSLELYSIGSILLILVRILPAVFLLFLLGLLCFLLEYLLLPRRQLLRRHLIH